MNDSPYPNVSQISHPTQVITEQSAPHREQRRLACSFCHRTLPEVRYLIGSTIAYICGNCLKRYSELADERFRSE